MEVTVVGSADAFNSAGRSHACYLLAGGTRPLMVDFGATALMALHRLDWSANQIGSFVFTHLHGDHIGGFPFLVIDAMFRSRRQSVLRCIGPIGLERTLLGLLELTYGLDILQKAPIELEFSEIAPHQSFEVEGLGLETFPADHMDPPQQPLCLRFIHPAGRIAFSGDTELGTGLKEAMEGTSLVFAECSGLDHPIGRHCAWSDWETYLPSLDSTEHVVLCHLNDEVRTQAPALWERYHRLKGPSSPKLSFVDDGDRFPLPVQEAP